MDVTNVQPWKKRKMGPKVGREREDRQKILEIVATDLVQDMHCRSAYTYLKELDMYHLKDSLY